MTGSFSIERIFEIDHNFQSLITSLKQVMKTVTIGGSYSNGIPTTVSFNSPKLSPPPLREAMKSTNEIEATEKGKT